MHDPMARRSAVVLPLVTQRLGAGAVRARATSASSPAPGSPGPLNAITDVAGVRVGHTTVVAGDTVRTGVTAILPHGGNLFREKVPGAVFVGNAFGKLAGSTQVQELGTIESPIVLTNTLGGRRRRSTRSSAGRSRSPATRTSGRSTRSSARPTTAR